MAIRAENTFEVFNIVSLLEQRAHSPNFERRGARGHHRLAQANRGRRNENKSMSSVQFTFRIVRLCVINNCLNALWSTRFLFNLVQCVGRIFLSAILLLQMKEIEKLEQQIFTKDRNAPQDPVLVEAVANEFDAMPWHALTLSRYGYSRIISIHLFYRQSFDNLNHMWIDDRFSKSIKFAYHIQMK